MHSLHPFLSFALAVGSAAAQSASVSTYGSGCTYANQVLAIDTVGLPQIGTTFSITYSGPNYNTSLTVQPVLALGLTPDNTPIPAGILPQQPIGCLALVVPLYLLPMPVTGSGLFQTSQGIAVPNDPTLIGFAFVAQWLDIAVQCGIVPPCWFSGLPTSDALLLTVGT